MSYDTNYIRPNHDAAMLEPLPERVSDDQYIQARKERENELYADLDYLRDEVIPACLDKIALNDLSFFLMHDTGGVNFVMRLSKACKAYIQEQARIDIDNQGDEV